MAAYEKCLQEIRNLQQAREIQILTKSFPEYLRNEENSPPEDHLVANMKEDEQIVTESQPFRALMDEKLSDHQNSLSDSMRKPMKQFLRKGSGLIRFNRKSSMKIKNVDNFDRSLKSLKVKRRIKLEDVHGFVGNCCIPISTKSSRQIGLSKNLEMKQEKFHESKTPLTDWRQKKINLHENVKCKRVTIFKSFQRKVEYRNSENECSMQGSSYKPNDDTFTKNKDYESDTNTEDEVTWSPSCDNIRSLSCCETRTLTKKESHKIDTLLDTTKREENSRRLKEKSSKRIVDMDAKIKYLETELKQMRNENCDLRWRNDALRKKLKETSIQRENENINFSREIDRLNSRLAKEKMFINNLKIKNNSRNDDDDIVSLKKEIIEAKELLKLKEAKYNSIQERMSTEINNLKNKTQFYEELLNKFTTQEPSNDDNEQYTTKATHNFKPNPQHIVTSTSNNTHRKSWHLTYKNGTFYADFPTECSARRKSHYSPQPHCSWQSSPRI